MISVKKRDLLTFISRLIVKEENKIGENISVFAGSGEDRSVIISPGLKIQHKDSRLVYTVSQVIISPNGQPQIYCYRSGREIIILPEMFKEYERL